MNPFCRGRRGRHRNKVTIVWRRGEGQLPLSQSFSIFCGKHYVAMVTMGAYTSSKFNKLIVFNKSVIFDTIALSHGNYKHTTFR